MTLFSKSEEEEKKEDRRKARRQRKDNPFRHDDDTDAHIYQQRGTKGAARRATVAAGTMTLFSKSEEEEKKEDRRKARRQRKDNPFRHDDDTDARISELRRRPNQARQGSPLSSSNQENLLPSAQPRALRGQKTRDTGHESTSSEKDKSSYQRPFFSLFGVRSNPDANTGLGKKDSADGDQHGRIQFGIVPGSVPGSAQQRDRSSETSEKTARSFSPSWQNLFKGRTKNDDRSMSDSQVPPVALKGSKPLTGVASTAALMTNHLSESEQNLICANVTKPVDWIESKNALAERARPISQAGTYLPDGSFVPKHLPTNPQQWNLPDTISSHALSIKKLSEYSQSHGEISGHSCAHDKKFIAGSEDLEPTSAIMQTRNARDEKAKLQATETSEKSSAPGSKGRSWTKKLSITFRGRQPSGDANNQSRTAYQMPEKHEHQNQQLESLSQTNDTRSIRTKSKNSGSWMPSFLRRPSDSSDTELGHKDRKRSPSSEPMAGEGRGKRRSGEMRIHGDASHHDTVLNPGATAAAPAGFAAELMASVEHYHSLWNQNEVKMGPPTATHDIYDADQRKTTAQLGQEQHVEQENTKRAVEMYSPSQYEIKFPSAVQHDHKHAADSGGGGGWGGGEGEGGGGGVGGGQQTHQHTHTRRHGPDLSLQENEPLHVSYSLVLPTQPPALHGMNLKQEQADYLTMSGKKSRHMPLDLPHTFSTAGRGGGGGGGGVGSLSYPQVRQVRPESIPKFNLTGEGGGGGGGSGGEASRMDATLVSNFLAGLSSCSPATALIPRRVEGEVGGGGIPQWAGLHPAIAASFSTTTTNQYHPGVGPPMPLQLHNGAGGRAGGYGGDTGYARCLYTRPDRGADGQGQSVVKGNGHVEMLRGGDIKGVRADLGDENARGWAGGGGGRVYSQGGVIGRPQGFHNM